MFKNFVARSECVGCYDLSHVRAFRVALPRKRKWRNAGDHERGFSENSVKNFLFGLRKRGFPPEQLAVQALAHMRSLDDRLLKRSVFFEIAQKLRLAVLVSQKSHVPSERGLQLFGER